MSKTRIVTGKCRASYVNVFKPRLNELSGVEEYSLVLLIPRSDSETLQKLETAINAAVRDTWGDKPPANWRYPIRDPREEGKTGEPWDGHVFVNVKSRNAPGVVDRNRQAVLDEREFVSGDYCRADLNAYAYDRKGNRGVSLALNNIQVIGRGDALTSRRRAEDAFDDYDEVDAKLARDWA